MRDGRLIQLEAVRGIAALVVLASHLLLGFFPRFHGLLFPDERVSPFGTPLFALVNGSAAVVVFFVLSGFVLTVRAFQTQSALPLVLGALKRWPRLALPVLVVNIASGVLVGWALYRNQPVAQQIASPWLGWSYTAAPEQWRSVAAAMREGAFSTFIWGSAYFNNPLWTMYLEFYGSFLAFFLAAVVLGIGGSAACAVAVLMLFCLIAFSPYLACFIVGVCLAWLYSGEKWEAMAGWLHQRGRVFWTGVLVLVVVLFGYHEAFVAEPAPTGFYGVLVPLNNLGSLQLRVALHTAGAVIMLVSVLALPALSSRLRGPAGALLGRLSFPVYLVHMPVICSMGTLTFLLASPAIGTTGGRAAALAVSAIVTFAVALPLMRMEAAWLAFLRAAGHRAAMWKVPWLHRVGFVQRPFARRIDVLQGKGRSLAPAVQRAPGLRVQQLQE